MSDESLRNEIKRSALYCQAYAYVNDADKSHECLDSIITSIKKLLLDRVDNIDEYCQWWVKKKDIKKMIESL